MEMVKISNICATKSTIARLILVRFSKMYIITTSNYHNYVCNAFSVVMNTIYT